MKLLIPRDNIAAKVSDLAQSIKADYDGRDLVLVGVMKGAFVFLADLMRQLKMPLAVDFVGLSSYGAGQVSQGVVAVTYPLHTDVRGKDVLVVEDIVDSGATLRFLRGYLAERGAATVRVCALLAREGQAVGMADYLGFAIGPGWVVGYGLDSGERYRNLPEIYLLEEGEK